MRTDDSFDPLEILRVLGQHEVPLIVIGGFAVAAHKVIRATRDLDIVTDRSWAAAEWFARALQSLDAVPLSDPAIEWIPEVLARPINIRIGTPHGELHVLNDTGGIPPFSGLQSTTIVVGDVEIQVASLAALREMKRAAGRPKDLIDLAELDAIHGPEA